MVIMIRKLFLCAASFICLPLFGQFTSTEFPPPGPQQFAGFGRSIAALGDVNNDGVADILVGASSEDVGGTVDVGRVYAISGADGSELYSVATSNPQQFGIFGFAMATADLTGDNILDLVIGSSEDVNGVSNAGRVYTFNGINGDFLYTVETPAPEQFAWFSRTLSGLGDLNNDGHDDFAVGSGESAGAVASGRVYVYSGLDGTFLYSIESANPNTDGTFGLALSSIDDLNGDGLKDLLIGSQETPDTLDRSGRAYVHSGSDGALIYTLDSENPALNGKFGWSVADAGDVNGDGTHDIAVGSEEPFDGFSQSGRAYLFSGADGSYLYDVGSPAPDFVDWFSRAISSVGDINGDSRDDLLIGAPFDDVGATLNAGQAYLVSGADGAILDSLATPNPQFEGLFGFSLVGNWNSSQLSDVDVMISAYRENIGSALNAGRIYRFRSMETSIERHEYLLPLTAALEQNYPNPFNPTTKIRWRVTSSGGKNVLLRIFDVMGRSVRTLVNEQSSVGVFEASWDGRDKNGNLMPSGVYLYQLKIGNSFTQSKKMLLIR